EGFTQSLFEFLRQKSSQDVGAAAWRERHDEGDLTLRVSLGAILRTGRRDRQYRQADGKQSAARKGDSPFWRHGAVLPVARLGRILLLACALPRPEHQRHPSGAAAQAFSAASEQLRSAFLDR